MRGLAEKARQGRRWILLALVALGYLWFFILERAVPTPVYVMYSPLDDLIPFVPWFVIPYVMWYFYLAAPAAALFLKDEDEFMRYGIMIMAGVYISCFVYTFWPNGIQLRPDLAGEPGICNALIRLLYSVDTPTNSAPSMHVALSIGAHVAIARLNNRTRKRPWIKPASLVLCMLIIASTVFIKQHSVVDLITGLALGLILYFAVYGKSVIREKRAAKTALSSI